MPYFHILHPQLLIFFLNLLQLHHILLHNPPTPLHYNLIIPNLFIMTSRTSQQSTTFNSQCLPLCFSHSFIVGIKITWIFKFKGGMLVCIYAGLMISRSYFDLISAFANISMKKILIRYRPNFIHLPFILTIPVRLITLLLLLRDINTLILHNILTKSPTTRTIRTLLRRSNPHRDRLVIFETMWLVVGVLFEGCFEGFWLGLGGEEVVVVLGWGVVCFFGFLLSCQGFCGYFSYHLFRCLLLNIE